MEGFVFSQVKNDILEIPLDGSYIVTFNMNYDKNFSEYLEICIKLNKNIFCISHETMSNSKVTIIRQKRLVKGDVISVEHRNLPKNINFKCLISYYKLD